jgi:hypothetical protein
VNELIQNSIIEIADRIRVVFEFRQFQATQSLLLSRVQTFQKKSSQRKKDSNTRVKNETGRRYLFRVLIVRHISAQKAFIG